MHKIMSVFLFFLLNGFIQTSFSAPRIWNGTLVTDPDKYPFMVSLEYNGNKPNSLKHECGGTLIAAKWILTAGHCVEDIKPNEMIIRYGTIDFNVNPGQVDEIVKIFIHPKYQHISESVGDFSTVVYDIALIELKNPINTATVMLPSPNLPKEDYAPGKYTTTIGWGAHDEPYVQSPELREVSLPIMTNEAVKNSPGQDGHVYHDLFDGELMMGILTENGQSLCNGDSGGPLLVKTELGYVQIGTASWLGGFLKCGEQGYPGVYTRLTNPDYLNWINDTIHQNVN